VERSQQDAAPARRRRVSVRTTSLFAHGEPVVWLTGGALAIAGAMILGLLLLVLAQGLPTFWPGPVVQLQTIDGRTIAGEVTLDEQYEPGEPAFDALDPDFVAQARERVTQDSGRARRRMVRVGNFELTQTHYRWVSDFEVAEESLPEWMLVLERTSWGRFYGVPLAATVDGAVEDRGAQEVWDAFQRHHASVRERWLRRRQIETEDIGAVNKRIERARLELRRVEMRSGANSPEWIAARDAAQGADDEAQREFAVLQEEIARLRDTNASYTLRVATADGHTLDLPMEQIVRAFPANRLGWSERVGVYLSRTAEFLLDEPREANSEGGVFPAIFGTVLMTLVMALLVTPCGVLAALYLREYAKPGLLVSAIRIAINNLAGVPSIVFGVFGLGFFCYVIGAGVDEFLFAEKLPTPTFGKGGILWASITLALLTLPVVIVPTEEALAAVPGSMREGSYACGATKWQTIWRIVLPRAMPGIMTGLILALARGAGEVAPLMLVGAVKLAPELPLDGSWPFLHPERSFMHLGFHIYDLGFQSQNSEAAKPMVYTTTLLLIALVVVLNLLAIWIRARLRTRFQGGSL
jgi:phosphate transport system permease protein